MKDLLGLVDEDGDVDWFVRKLVKCFWWIGGPWNHHSRSGASKRYAARMSLLARASYRAIATFLLCSSSISFRLA
ncbi:hypothetical protein OIU76_023366 [Salix suchowensis]|nr:hypothetical protein OIU76_023366 [Salix suchowensis]